MIGVILCTIALALANFGVEAFRDVPSYIDAAMITWNQFFAIMIYYIFWEKQ